MKQLRRSETELGMNEQTKTGVASNDAKSRGFGKVYKHAAPMELEENRGFVEKKESLVEATYL